MTDALEGLRTLIAEVVRAELGRSPSQAPDEYMTTGDAAKFAAVAPGTIRRWVRLGKLRDCRAGRRVRVSRADLQRMLRDGTPRNDSSTPEQRAMSKDE